MSTPVSPALVRAVMDHDSTQLDKIDWVILYLMSDHTDILRDHIRAVAAEMREAAIEVRAEGFETIGAFRLEELANKLEGIE